jgi:hypothetical protein
MVIGQPFLHCMQLDMRSALVAMVFYCFKSIAWLRCLWFCAGRASVKVKRKEMAMGLALKGLLGELESCRSKGWWTDEVTRVEVVRTLEIPLDLHAVVSCGCWRMCSANQAELAAVVLRAALDGYAGASG